LASGGSGDAPIRGSGIRARARTDHAWSHCLSIIRKAMNVKSNYCEKVLTCGINQWKH